MSDVFWATQERTQMGLHVGLVMGRSLKCCLCLISRVHEVELRRTLNQQDLERSMSSGRKEFRRVWLVVSREGGFPYTQLQLAP